MGFRVPFKILLVVVTAGLCVAAPAGAATTSRALEAAGTTAGSCTDSLRGGAAIATTTMKTPGVRTVSARLKDAGGNWDLAVFDASGRLVAGSAYADGDEIAEGFADTRQITVQACRVSGSDPTARVKVVTHELTEPAPVYQLVRVSTPTKEVEDRLVASGLDLTEHGGPGYLDVVLHGPGDAEILQAKGFTYDVVVSNLLKQDLADRASERVAARGATPALPSGRDPSTYRRLVDYSEEMQALAEDNPKLVRYFTLPHETYSGRKVEAIEVAPKVKRRDGRPTFVMLGVHHAREWPSGESTLEFAYELINGWKSGDKRIRRLLKKSRVVFVPIVNPDGFNTSREAGELGGAAGGRDAPGGDETPNLVIPYEYQRKNCRYLPPLEDMGGNCMQPLSTGLAQFGVDPNRNYGMFWGGPGATPPDGVPFGPLAQDYRGPGPFSEPETQNIQWLVSRRQVTTLITNHTFAALVLRPPGLQSQGPPPDEKALKRLGDAMAHENGYTSQKGYELYDTTGTTEDWSYNATGGFGYTFELGGPGFHSPYQVGVVDEYFGNVEGAAGGNEAAYLLALRSTTNRKRHALIRGRAPKGAILTLTKKFKTPSSPVINGDGEEGDVVFTKDKLRTTLKVGRRGAFTWDVNPSTRPLLIDAKTAPRPRKGKPSDPLEFSGDGTTATPCADAETTDPGCWNDHPFRVPGGKGIDNGKATVRVTWPSPATDWDMKIFRDSDKDGSSEGETNLVGSSASGPSNVEESTIARPGLRRGKYVVRMIDYAGAEPYAGRIVFNKTARPTVVYHPERWTLTCKRSKKGPVLARKKIRVERGRHKRVDLRKACRN